MTTKKDTLGRAIGKRKNNGPEDKGISGDTQLIRGRPELLDAMREKARLEGISVSVAWRRAAIMFLEHSTGTAGGKPIVAPAADWDAREHRAAEPYTKG